MLEEQAPPGPRGAAAPFHLEFLAQAYHLAELRHALAMWLDGAEVPELLASDITLAVAEACANSIEHGYRNTGDGMVRVSARQDGEVVVVSVSDSGQWKTAVTPLRTRGRGLPLMRAVSSDCEVHTSLSGTSVSLVFDPSRPVP